MEASRSSDIVRRRLAAQHLTGKQFSSPVEVVGWFGAIQSQDYPAALWAVGQRTSGATEAQLNGLFDRGEILRTHVMRPTLHFVLPADIH
jgi:hypothetical protein